MACDKTPKAKKPAATQEVAQNTTTQEEKKMSSTLVMREVPEFEMEAYDSKTGHYTTVKSSDYKGKWLVVCFYPADFTFVCPTEIAAMNAKLDELNAMGVEVLAASTDTKFSHKRFVETEPILKGLKMTIAADPNTQVSRAFGVFMEDEGVALRGRFIINPDGLIVAEEVQAAMVGRNVNELIRQLQAWQHAYKTGEVCPANWRPGKKTLPVNTDAEPMTGNVGGYVTLQDLLD